MKYKIYYQDGGNDVISKIKENLKIWKYYNSKKISFDLEKINNKDKNFDYINNLINESKRKKNKNIKISSMHL